MTKYTDDDIVWLLHGLAYPLYTVKKDTSYQAAKIIHTVELLTTMQKVPETLTYDNLQIIATRLKDICAVVNQINYPTIALVADVNDFISIESLVNTTNSIVKQIEDVIVDFEQSSIAVDLIINKLRKIYQQLQDIKKEQVKLIQDVFIIICKIGSKGTIKLVESIYKEFSS